MPENMISSLAELQAKQQEFRSKIALREDESVPGSKVRMNIMCCSDTACDTSGAPTILSRFEDLVAQYQLEDEVKVYKTGCIGFCQRGPIVAIYPGKVMYQHVRVEDVDRIFREHVLMGKPVSDLQLSDVDPNTGVRIVDIDKIPFYKKQQRIALRDCGVINPEDIEEYIAAGGYQAMGKAITSMTPQEVIDEISKSGLRGRGGAGFPTGRKWQFERNAPGDEKYVICNADEGDPGAFMDRSILEGDPHSVLEGMAIMAYAVGAFHGYIYVRAEYPMAVKRLNIAIRQAHELGLLGDHILNTNFSFDIELRLGAGAFVCGEETALIHSIEGQRGMPSAKPPFPATHGVWGKPTSINNVETLANVPIIMANGADWYASIGTEKSKGTKVFALGGKINNTGIVEVPMGTTLREMIYDIGGGCPNGKKFKAVQTGGPSGGCLTEKELDTPIDYESLIAAGSMMGSGGMIVLDEDNCMVDVARFYMEFICDESCGKCTPCRVGTKRLLEMLTDICEGRGTMEMLDEMEQLCYEIKDTALCGLGQTAPNPVLSILKNFRPEVEAHIKEKRCPAGVCKKLLTYSIDPDKCRKCSMCARNCPVGAINGVPGKVAYSIDTTKCIKCGSCMTSCRFGAVSRK